MEEAEAANGQDAGYTFLGNSDGRDARATMGGCGMFNGRWLMGRDGMDGERGV
jgi:hypothetical protein